jgi:hypothetical protein
MVDYGSHLYFDPTPLMFVKEPTPVPDELKPAAGPSMTEPALSWQPDPRFVQYNGGNGNMSNVSTPSRTSLRLQHQQPHQQQQHPHQPVNGYGNGIPMGNPYPYGLTNGRTPEQQHYAQAQAQAQVQMQTPHPYYDASHSQGHSQHQAPGHSPHAMTNGISIGGPASPMMGRQMSMSSGIGMGMEYGGGLMGGPSETPAPDARRRTRSQHDGHIEMGWWYQHERTSESGYGNDILGSVRSRNKICIVYCSQPLCLPFMLNIHTLGLDHILSL